ncbi:MAG TPA: NUDIX hydrolase [Alphaproteobacteria bacterium]
MPRTALKNLLETYQPSAAETAFKPAMLALLEQYQDCFDRSRIPPGHFTASAWLVGHQGEKALLTHHGILKRWFQLGGHADGNPDLLKAAQREAEEESGLDRVIPLLPSIFDIDIHEIPENPKRGEAAHNHYDVRFLFYSPDTTFKISDESLDVAWFSSDEIDTLNPDEAVRRQQRKWAELRKNGRLAELIRQAEIALENFN